MLFINYFPDQYIRYFYLILIQAHYFLGYIWSVKKKSWHIFSLILGIGAGWMLYISNLNFETIAYLTSFMFLIHFWSDSLYLNEGFRYPIFLKLIYQCSLAMLAGLVLLQFVQSVPIFKFKFSGTFANIVTMLQLQYLVIYCTAVHCFRWIFSMNQRKKQIENSQVYSRFLLSIVMVHALLVVLFFGLSWDSIWHHSLFGGREFYSAGFAHILYFLILKNKFLLKRLSFFCISVRIMSMLA